MRILIFSKKTKVFPRLSDNINRGEQGSRRLPPKVRGFTLRKKYAAHKWAKEQGGNENDYPTQLTGYELPQAAFHQQ